MLTVKLLYCRNQYLSTGVQQVSGKMKGWTLPDGRTPGAGRHCRYLPPR